AYMFRPDVKLQFSGRTDYRQLSAREVEILRAGSADGIFTAAILGGVVVAVLMLVVGGVIMIPTMVRSRALANEASVVGDLRTMISAEEAFRGGTCGTGYADLEGLTRPATVIPSYPASGPAFLRGTLAAAERHGYRFELLVEDPVPAAEGCPSRSFRRYRYAATPLATAGRSFLAAADGT